MLEQIGSLATIIIIEIIGGSSTGALPVRRPLFGLNIGLSLGRIEPFAEDIDRLRQVINSSLPTLPTYPTL